MNGARHVPGRSGLDFERTQQVIRVSRLQSLLLRPGTCRAPFVSLMLLYFGVWFLPTLAATSE